MEEIPLSEVLNERPKSSAFGFRIPIISKANLIRPETSTAFRAALDVLKSFQRVFGVLALIYMFTIPEIRRKLFRKDAMQNFEFGVFEGFNWFMMATLLGAKRIPVNYIALFYLKAFLYLEPYTDVGDWSKLGFFAQLTSYFTPKDSAVAKTDLEILPVVVPLTLVTTILTCTQIKIGAYESVALVGTTFATAMSTVLLLTSMGTPNWSTGEVWKAGHFRFCVLWAYCTVTLAFFNTIFILERAWSVYKGKLTPNRYMRGLIEIIIWALSVYVVMVYMPKMQPSFGFKSAFTLNALDLLSPVVPTYVKEAIRPARDESWDSCKDQFLRWLDRVRFNVLGEDVESPDGEVESYTFTSTGWTRQ